MSNVLSVDKDLYRITKHARNQLSQRWPDTVFRPTSFDDIVVPRNAPQIGYISATGCMYVDVPGTPMAAAIQGDVVVTFLTLEAAKANVALHGFGPDDFYKGRKQSYPLVVYAVSSATRS